MYGTMLPPMLPPTAGSAAARQGDGLAFVPSPGAFGSAGGFLPPLPPPSGSIPASMTPAQQMLEAGELETMMPVKPTIMSKFKSRIASGEKRVVGSMQMLWDHLPDFLMPWAIFAMMLWTSLLVQAALRNLAMLVCIVISTGFLCLGKGRPWIVFGAGCMVAVPLGMSLGYAGAGKYIHAEQLISHSRVYGNVRPDGNPLAQKDAGMIFFSEDSFVDVARSVGLREGSLYCAAPVVNSVHQTSAGYWAIGKDCCQVRGRFLCGEVLGASKSSVVVMEGDALGEQELAHYRSAASMAAGAYGISMDVSPTFVHWTANTQGYKDSLWRSGYTYCAWVTAIMLAVMFTAASTFGLAYPYQRFEVPFPEGQLKMWFGPDCGCCGSEAPEGPEIERDLLQGRCCWSGEVLHDYVFWVCNTTLFLGCLGCHPAHPYSRWERIVVCFVVCALIVIPVSLISLFLAKESMLRIVLVAILVTGPRNLMKFYLMRVVVEDADITFLEGQPDGETQKRALHWEILIMSIISVGTIWLCIWSVQFIDSMGMPVMTVLWESCDGLGWAFVLELLFGLLMPKVVHGDYGKTWLIGFFGRWMFERDQLARAGKI